jgi:hypothetical protein
MGRITEFKDPEYERQLAEFKARKARALAERQAQPPEQKKVITEKNWISVKKEQ